MLCRVACTPGDVAAQAGLEAPAGDRTAAAARGAVVYVVHDADRRARVPAADGVDVGRAGGAQLHTAGHLPGRYRRARARDRREAVRGVDARRALASRTGRPRQGRQTGVRPDPRGRAVPPTAPAWVPARRDRGDARTAVIGRAAASLSAVSCLSAGATTEAASCSRSRPRRHRSGRASARDPLLASR